MGIREETEKKVFAYIEEHNMISPGDRIVAGVSGGADSVCLLELLSAYGKKVPLSMAVVHVNHGLRQDAGEDAGYVEELCREKGIPFFLTESDVHRTAREEGCSEEDAGRRIRYRAFRQAAEAIGGRKVAVAHNSNDNAETMLFNLFRGSGIRGISGIAPLRADGDGISVLRPILCLERQEVEAYLRERGIPWRMDSTNEKDDYSRNRIRHHILPYAEQEVAGAVGHMLRTAGQLQEAEEYLREQTEEALLRCTVPAEAFTVSGGTIAVPAEAWALPEGAKAAPGVSDSQSAAGAGTRNRNAMRYQIDAGAFLGFRRILQGRMLLELLKRLSPTGKDISAVHVRDVLSLFGKKGNRSISLPFGITARRQNGLVILECAKDREQTGALGGMTQMDGAELWQPVEVPLSEELFQKPALYDLGELGKIEFSAFFIKNTAELPQNRYTKWFDYDKMEERAVIRTRGRGDFLTIADGKGKTVHKSLKDYMIGEKIPRRLRDGIRLVAFGNHILWLVGWRISEDFKVSGDTERVLQVRLLKKQGSGTEEKDVGAH